MKKGKKIAIVVAVILLILAIAAGVLYFVFAPYLRLYQYKNEITDSRYRYNIEYEVTESKIAFLDGKIKGNISGVVQRNVLYGKVYGNDTLLTEVYYKNGKVTADLAPALKLVVTEVGSHSSLPFGYLTTFIKDIYADSDQLAYILGEDFMSGNFFENIDFEITKLKEIEDCSYTNCYYFELADVNSDLVIYLALPKERRASDIFARIEKSGYTVDLTAEHSFISKDKIEVPEATITQEQIELIKSLVDKWRDYSGEDNSI